MKNESPWTQGQLGTTPGVKLAAAQTGTVGIVVARFGTLGAGVS
jgi:hypothetical protein